MSSRATCAPSDGQLDAELQQRGAAERREGEERCRAGVVCVC
jgi:hypothetical protein